MKKFIAILFTFAYLFAQYDIEGRWHLVGFEDAVMYQFVDTELFADAGLRYTIYSIDGSFSDLDGDGTGGTPNPYSILNDTITIDYHFGNVVSYEMNYRCDGQVVDFYDINYDLVAFTIFREFYEYSNCEEVIEDCYSFTDLDFGDCEMVLGVGLINDECSYISGCDWTIGGVDYSNFFYSSIEDCHDSCNVSQCEDGFVEINSLCFHEGDLSVIQLMLDSSYASGIDLDCADSPYCGSPNPFMDSGESWTTIQYDEMWYEVPGNMNGVVEPLELGVQEWENGRLTSLMCGAYIYCQLSGPIPVEVGQLTELKTFRVEGNYFSGFIPDTVCDLGTNYEDSLEFDLRYNRLCPPYPDCIYTDSFWGQYSDDCSEIGDINYDSAINVVDIVVLVSVILQDTAPDYQTLTISDLNSDGSLNVLDVITLVSHILDR